MQIKIEITHIISLLPLLLADGKDEVLIGVEYGGLKNGVVVIMGASKDEDGVLVVTGLWVLVEYGVVTEVEVVRNEVVLIKDEDETVVDVRVEVDGTEVKKDEEEVKTSTESVSPLPVDSSWAEETYRIFTAVVRHWNMRKAFSVLAFIVTGKTHNTLGLLWMALSINCKDGAQFS